MIFAPLLNVDEQAGSITVKTAGWKTGIKLLIIWKVTSCFHFFSGRGRTKDSEMYLLAYGDLKFIEKEKTNEERNKLVHRALQKLRVMDRDALKTKVGFDPTSATVNVISGVAKLLDRSLYTF